MEIKINKTPLNGICKAIKKVNQNNNNIGYFLFGILNHYELNYPLYYEFILDK